jgi:hypothetical protein
MIAGLAIAVLLSGPGAASSESMIVCVCGAPTRTVLEDAQQADAVFLGTVVEQGPLEGDDFCEGGGIRATMVVRKVWRGSVGARDVVYSAADCGCASPFKVGEEYVVFASGDSLESRQCGRTTPLRDPSGQDLARTLDRAFAGGHGPEAATPPRPRPKASVEPRPQQPKRIEIGMSCGEPAERGTLRVRVVADDAGAIPGARVGIVRMLGYEESLPQQVVTDARGEAEVRLAPESYVLLLGLPGFASEVVKTRVGNGCTTTVTARLRVVAISRLRALTSSRPGV